MFASVIIPTYRRKCILSCLDALKKQTKLAPEFEVIVVARDVSDYLIDFFKKAPTNFKLCVYTEPGNGPAKNYASLTAKGKFLAFLDDDCIPDRNWLLQLYYGQSLTGADIVIGDCKPYDTSNPYLVAHQHHIQYYLEKLAPERICYPKTVCGTTMNMLIRKSTFMELQGFDAVFANYHGDDRMFNVKWASNARIHAIYNRFAVVAHNHPFTLRTFIRASFRYGVGIQKCAELASSGGYKDIPAPPRRDEYEELIKFSLGRSIFNRWYIALMIVVSQEVKRIGMWYIKYNPKYTSK